MEFVTMAFQEVVCARAPLASQPTRRVLPLSQPISWHSQVTRRVRSVNLDFMVKVALDARPSRPLLAADTELAMTESVGTEPVCVMLATVVTTVAGHAPWT